MGMLDRIKKRQNDGFKEFVISMETSGGTTRGSIFMAGVLEDPVFMMYVMKNIRTFDDLLNLDGEELEAILNGQEQMMNLFAKALQGFDDQRIMSLEGSIPRLISRLKDELSYLKNVPQMEVEGAKFYILKYARKLQSEEKIHGFRWNLPPQDVYYPKTHPDGNAKIFFENGIVAAEGPFLKNRRMGTWKHYYELGTLLGEGDYFDGLKEGVWKFYYSNKKLKSEGKYRADLKHGLWKEYDRNGEVREVDYLEGVKKEN